MGSDLLGRITGRHASQEGSDQVHLWWVKIRFGITSLMAGMVLAPSIMSPWNCARRMAHLVPPMSTRALAATLGLMIRERMKRSGCDGDIWHPVNSSVVTTESSFQETNLPRAQ